MQEPEVIVMEVEALRRTKGRWKITAICALAALAAVLPVDALKTWVLMNQISLERDRALQAERQADIQREEFLRSLLDWAQEASRRAQKTNGAAKTKEKVTAPDRSPNR